MKFCHVSDLKTLLAALVYHLSPPSALSSPRLCTSQIYGENPVQNLGDLGAWFILHYIVRLGYVVLEFFNFEMYLSIFTIFCDVPY